MPHSNLCRSWVICSTRSFRVLHAGVDTQQPKLPLSNRRALRFPFLLVPLPSCALVLSFSCHLASWCEHMPGACGTVPRPQSTIHLQPLPLHHPLPLLGLRFLSIYFCFCRFRSTFLMPVKHENAFAIPTFTCIPPHYPPSPIAPLYPSLASVAL